MENINLCLKAMDFSYAFNCLNGENIAITLVTHQPDF